MGSPKDPVFPPVSSAYVRSSRERTAAVNPSPIHKPESPLEQKKDPAPPLGFPKGSGAQPNNEHTVTPPPKPNVNPTKETPGYMASTVSSRAKQRPPLPRCVITGLTAGGKLLHKASPLEIAAEQISKQEQLRSKAVGEGLPPMVAQATQISTKKWGNVVAYRGSGPIPPGLYNDIFTGKARPKPVTEKAKSSNYGPMEGRAVKDSKNGRFQKDENGEYKIRLETPPNLPARPLETSLRDIYNDLGSKYELVGEKNPDEGILRFKQINHPCPKVEHVIFSVDLNKANPIDPNILKNYHLVSDQFANKKADPNPGDPLHGINLDVLCQTYSQHPKDKEPRLIEVLGDIVRDCDVDTITDPSQEILKKWLGEIDVKPFLEPLDMSHHKELSDNEEKKFLETCTPEEKKAYIEKDLAEAARAEKAASDMVYALIKINTAMWMQYNEAKKEAQQIAGDHFNEAQWELENIEKKPIVKEGANFELMSAMVVTQGLGTPMQLYQSLEINVIQQKILDSVNAKNGTRVNTRDLDSTIPAIRNAALLKLHQQEIDYSRETIAKAFIQHPTEAYNRHYTCPRGNVVMVADKTIKIGNDQALSQLILELDQTHEINPQWLKRGSLADQNSALWAAHYLATYEKMHKDRINEGNPDALLLKEAVDNVLISTDKDKVISSISSIQETIAKVKPTLRHSIINYLEGNHRDLSSAVSDQHASRPTMKG